MAGGAENLVQVGLHQQRESGEAVELTSGRSSQTGGVFYGSIDASPPMTALPRELEDWVTGEMRGLAPRIAIGTRCEMRRCGKCDIANNSNKLFLIMGTLMVLFLANSCLMVAQGTGVSSSPVKGGSKSNGGPVLYSSLPLDIESEKLPFNYRGNDPEKLCQFLNKVKPSLTRGEYETSAEYSERLQRVKSESHLDHLDLDSVFAFQVGLDATQFNADTENFQLFLEKGKTSHLDLLDPLINDTPHFTVELETIDKELGVKGRVRLLEANTLGISIMNPDAFITSPYVEHDSELGIDIPKEGFLVELKMSRKEVMEVRKNVKALLLCKLMFPYVKNGEFAHSTPSLHDPYDIRMYGSKMFAELLQIWFYDMTSGRVLAKVVSSSEANAPARALNSQQATTTQHPTVNLNPPVEKRLDRIQVDGSLQFTKLIAHAQPIYPPLAKSTRVQGTVRMNAVIGEDGTVKSLSVVSGHPLLVQAALDAVKQWRYEQTQINGVPVEVVTTVDVNFVLP